jgi:hypothetical protein
MTLSISSIHRTLTERFARKNASDTPAKQQKSLLSLVAESLKTCFTGRPSPDRHQNDAVGVQPTLREWPQISDTSQTAGMETGGATRSDASLFSFSPTENKTNAQDRLTNIEALQVMTLLGRRKTASTQEKRPDGLIPLPTRKLPAQQVKTVFAEPSLADWRPSSKPAEEDSLNAQLQKTLVSLEDVINDIDPAVRDIAAQLIRDKYESMVGSQPLDVASLVEAVESIVNTAHRSDTARFLEFAFDEAFGAKGTNLTPYLSRLADISHPGLSKTAKLLEEVFMTQVRRREATR